MIVVSIGRGGYKNLLLSALALLNSRLSLAGVAKTQGSMFGLSHGNCEEPQLVQRRRHLSVKAHVSNGLAAVPSFVPA